MSRKPDPFCSVVPITFSMRRAEHTENDRRYRTERVLLARLAEEAMSAASALKDATNHKWFGPITTSPERMLRVMSSRPILYSLTALFLDICTFLEFQ